VATNIRDPRRPHGHKGDAALWMAAQQDAAAFGELCERHIAGIHAYVSKRVGDGAAADLTAEALAQAWRGRKRLCADKDDEVPAWLYGIARNLVRRYLRDQVVETRARRRLGMQVDLAEEGSYAALEDMLAAESVAPQLRGALRRLPPGQRRAVALRVVRDMPYADIGRALGCSEPVARMKVARGLRALRSQLEHQGGMP
jgi:RNA polymerase sigma factor (sigma-70 family)